MLQNLYLSKVLESLDEIAENGDYYGYDTDKTGYYLEYKPLFDELSADACDLQEAILQEFGLDEHWDDMTVALLGETHTVLGFDEAEMDYFSVVARDEKQAITEAVKRLERMTKHDLILTYRRVMVSLAAFWDIKAGHDCLTAIVDELDERSAIFNQKETHINRLYQDLTGADDREFDRVVSSLPQRMWLE